MRPSAPVARPSLPGASVICNSMRLPRLAATQKPLKPVRISIGQTFSTDSIQCSRYDATAFNSQRGNANNERKSQQVDNAIRLGDAFFVSEIQSSYVPPAGAQILSASGRTIPTGGLNYIVPASSGLYTPVLPGDVVVALQAAGRPSSYAGLWGLHVRYPADLGIVNNVRVFGIHSKSRPSIDAQYALAGLILNLKDTIGGNWALIGDLNLEEATLQQRINELRLGGTAGLHFKCLGRATHTCGKELDYLITTDAGADVEQISRMGLRNGADHSGVGVDFS